VKTYLGDGVYADFDGWHVILTTENGIETTNRIYLEPEVRDEVLKFFERVAAARKEATG
jgi:hypothetical protein